MIRTRAGWPSAFASSATSLLDASASIASGHETPRRCGGGLRGDAGRDAAQRLDVRELVRAGVVRAADRVLAAPRSGGRGRGRRRSAGRRRRRRRCRSPSRTRSSSSDPPPAQCSGSSLIADLRSLAYAPAASAPAPLSGAENYRGPSGEGRLRSRCALRRQAGVLTLGTVSCRQPRREPRPPSRADPDRFPERQRSIPHSSRRRSPEAPAGARRTPQGDGWKALLAPEIPADPRPDRRDQDRPVTPEVAGSSPVAPALSVESPPAPRA